MDVVIHDGLLRIATGTFVCMVARRVVAVLRSQEVSTSASRSSSLASARRIFTEGRTAGLRKLVEQRWRYYPISVGFLSRLHASFVSSRFIESLHNPDATRTAPAV
jgi:hypothetical protein